VRGRNSRAPGWRPPPILRTWGRALPLEREPPCSARLVSHGECSGSRATNLSKEIRVDRGMRPDAQVAAAPPPPRQRPTGVTALALLQFADGGLTLLFSALALASEPSAPRAPAFIAVALVKLGVGWGLLAGKKWAWWITLILATVSLLGALAGVAVGEPSALSHLPLAALILWYMFKPHVKEFFGVKVPLST